MNTTDEQQAIADHSHFLLTNALLAVGFKLESTADNSPTLRLIESIHSNDKSIYRSESMHHSAGAAAETRYIYGDVFDTIFAAVKKGALSQSKKIRTCVVGLGLGYIEINWALSLLHFKIPLTSSINFTSFEIVPELRQMFLEWVYDKPSEQIAKLQCEQITDLHDRVALALQNGQGTRSDLAALKSNLALALQNESRIDENILTSTSDSQWNVVCYDAFSRKTNEGLWSENFLDSFLSKRTDKDCVFTTYACTAILKKMLLKHGFKIINRQGFSGKRESTLAVRGEFASLEFPTNFHSMKSYQIS